MTVDKFNGNWPWKNFAPREIACKCCGELWLKDAMPSYFILAMDKLQALRDLWGEPIIINSGHRCSKHNADVGGVKGSQHLTIAFDCRCPKERQKEFAELALKTGFHVARPYPDKGFVHLDMGRPRTW